MAHSVILFGGTFDPPHVGHLTMAQLALEQTRADAVWFIPSPDPPHKTHESHMPFALRVQMTEALVQVVDPTRQRLQVSRVEESLPRPSYSIDTIRHVKQAHPDILFTFLVGSDSLHDLPTWHEADRLVQELPFLVVPRGQHPVETTLSQVQRALPALKCTVIDMPQLDVSSTWIRSRYDEGRPLCGLVPNSVIALLARQS